MAASRGLGDGDRRLGRRGRRRGRAREAGELGALGADLGGELGDRAVLDHGVEVEARLEQRAQGADLAPGGAAAPAGAGVLVPCAGEAGDVGAPAVSVRGEHRADAAGLRVDVGADDDPVGVDAAQHRLPGVARQPLDGDAQAARGVAAGTSHRENGARGGAVSQWRERGRNAILQTFLVAAFGDAGHAFPAIGLARALAARGHEVVVETWERWREAVEGAGLGFTAAEEYKTFPPPPPGSGEGPSAADAALALLPMLERERFDVVVSDILTLAPALAAERAGFAAGDADPARVSGARGRGCRSSRSARSRRARRSGGRCGARALPVLVGGLRRGREEMNESRAVVGLPPLERFHGGIREQLALVATFPQLEYPRRWPAQVRVTGPIGFELPHPDVELPEGEAPLVLVAPSTAQDPECRLVRAALEALADEPVRVLATINRQRPEPPLPAPPANAVVVDWLSYSQAMPLADLVVCHGGHGTVARALGAGVPVLCCPAVGDMAENGARVAWAGAGLMLPWRLMGAGDAAAGGAAGARGRGRSRRGRARSPPGRGSTTGRRGARSWSRRWRAGH